MKKYFGIDCPGCGLQRSFVSLLRGDLQESLALYPGLIPFMMLGILAALSFFGIYTVKARYLTIMATLTAVIVLVHYFLKITGNAPWFYEAEMHYHK